MTRSKTVSPPRRAAASVEPLRRKASPAPQIFSDDAREDLLDRLRRVEGQVRGVQRMVEEGRDCRAILNQLTAVRAAAYQVSLLLVRDYATQCLRESDEAETIDDLVKTLSHMPY
jgi:DNA-binding FrmR family transcriptional regulator